MASSTRTTRNTGIEVRHSRRCGSARGTQCSCSPTYRAQVFSRRENRTIRKTFESHAEAKAWRSDAQVALRRGTLTGAKSATLHDAATAWLAGAASGAVRNRSGDVYKPSTIRGYEQALRIRVLPDLGPIALSEVQRAELQAFVDRLLEADHDPSTIRNTLLPVRAIFRRAVARGEVAVTPTTGLELPAVRVRRDRIASPEEARQLLAALVRDGGLWATAMYSGLRMGELRALEWDAIDFDRGLIHVRRTWDHIEGPVEPKSRAGRRAVPLPTLLRADLAAHRLACPWREGLVFGRSSESPFNPSTINNPTPSSRWQHSTRWRTAIAPPLRGRSRVSASATSCLGLRPPSVRSRPARRRELARSRQGAVRHRLQRPRARPGALSRNAARRSARRRRVPRRSSCRLSWSAAVRSRGAVERHGDSRGLDARPGCGSRSAAAGWAIGGLERADACGRATVRPTRSRVAARQLRDPKSEDMRRCCVRVTDCQSVRSTSRGSSRPPAQPRCRMSSTLAAVGGSWIVVGFAVLMLVVLA